MRSLADALAKGAMASLKQLYITGKFSDAAKEQLKTVCKERGITGSSFLS